MFPTQTLAAEFVSRNVEFSVPLKDTDDGCVDSNARTLTATCCFLVVLVHEGATTHEKQQNRSRIALNGLDLMPASGRNAASIISYVTRPKRRASACSMFFVA
jgi:hypothetical protein